MNTYWIVLVNGVPKAITPRDDNSPDINDIVVDLQKRHLNSVITAFAVQSKDEVFIGSTHGTWIVQSIIVPAAPPPLVTWGQL